MYWIGGYLAKKKSMSLFPDGPRLFLSHSQVHSGRGDRRYASRRTGLPHRVGDVSVVKCGVVKNYLRVRHELVEQGCEFVSDCDLEVIARLVDRNLKQTGIFEQSVLHALRELKGDFSVCLTCENEPRTLIAAGMGLPLALGIGDSDYIVSSNITSMAALAHDLVLLDKGEIAICRESSVVFASLDGEPLEKIPYRAVCRAPGRSRKKSAFQHKRCPCGLGRRHRTSCWKMRKMVVKFKHFSK